MRGLKIEKIFILLLLMFAVALVSNAEEPKLDKPKGPFAEKLNSDDDHWEIFKNTKNHFEFQKPVCFELTAGEIDDPSKSNLVIVGPGEKCKTKSIKWMSVDFTSPEGVALMDLDRHPTLRQGTRYIERKIDLNGRKAVLAATRYNDGRNYDGVVWDLFTSCNKKNMYIGAAQNLTKSALEKIQKGIGEPSLVIDTIFRSFKCSKD